MTFIKQNYILLLGLIALGIGLIFTNVKSYNTNQTGLSFCNITQQACELVIDNQILSVYFVAPPEIEERLYLTIKADNAFTVKSIVIQGVNMYMGKIPVVEEKTENKETTHWLGWTYLGACSEPNMIWELELTVDTNDGEKKGYLRFETSLE